MRYYEEEPHRGRPRGRQSYSSWSILSSVAQIAAKYNLDPRLLLDAFTKAWVHERSQYGKLEIECRKVDADSAVFLITCEGIVIWQFPIGIEILQQSESYKSAIPIIPTPIGKQDSTPKQISDLRNNMRRITVKGRIVEVPTKTLVNTRYGFEAYVSNVLLADETGTIRLSLWNDHIGDVAVGDTVSIEKARVAMFCGVPQLRIGKSGIVRVDTSRREVTAI
jgi:hypothetical protein